MEVIEVVEASVVVLTLSARLALYLKKLFSCCCCSKKKKNIDIPKSPIMEPNI